MITLDNFESCVPYRILVRGEEYYDTDAVSELEETSPGEWTATVEGTDDYNVEISMNGKEVESWYCDCPYDGEICKHVVAALLAIRDNNKRVSRSIFKNENSYKGRRGCTARWTSNNCCHSLVARNFYIYQ